MIFGFLNDLFGSIILLSIVFVIALVLEYRYNYIGNFINQLKDVWSSMTRPFEAQGFEDMGLSPEIYGPVGKDEGSKLSPGDAFSTSNEKLLSDFLKVESDSTSQKNWAKISSQRCLKHDEGEQLKPLANYYQRTNNYMRTHPDDCSAPFHEMIGTFYEPEFGVGKTIPTGLPLPGSVVSCNGQKQEILGNSSHFTNSLTSSM